VSLVRRSLTVATLAIAAVLLLVAPAAAATSPPPSSIASLGDSITRGFNACGWYVDCPSRSFSTGDYSAVNSHYLRIRAKNPAINGRNYNDAVSGAKVANMSDQVGQAVSQGVQYLTMLIGANDACTSSEGTMTSVTAFHDNLNNALTKLKTGLPNARILLVSIPDLKRLWYVGKGNFGALSAWSAFRVCQSMLANPLSNSATDNARRDRVRQRVIDFNAQLAQACVAYGSLCMYDGGAVFNYPFALSQLSTWDYFHPNTSGHAVLAQVSYAAGFGW
jgi:lysophospholipase L1-like esterase